MDRRFYLVAIVAVVLAAGVYLAGGGSTPAGQPPIADLGAGLADLKAQFNADVSKTRVILLVSQTCPYCLRGAAEFERVLESHAGAPLAVFAVWQPILPTDWGKPGSGPLSRLRDARVRQYWDADHRVALELNRAAEKGGPQTECCYDRGVPWDLMAVYPPGALWEEMLPEPAMYNGIIMDVVEQFETLLAQAR